ncbi:MAG: histidinol-phosphatase [Clostridia bacterium]|nr:histidinol-phosphatase [Clostridia bacterium]
MLTYNLHTHTTRCLHASGEDREYVESAIKGGVKTLGFSDHSPYVFKDGYYSGFRMKPDELEGYVKSVLDMKTEFKNDIEIFLGLEAEYYPEFFDAFLELIRPYPIDYLICGQHFTKNEMGDAKASGWKTSEKDVLFEYAHQVTQAMQTGRFTYLAHPDLIKYREGDESENEAWRIICENAKKHNVPLEINLLGIRDHRHYPYAGFWKIAGEIQTPVTIGADAHSPDAVCDNASFETAMLIVKKYGLKYIGIPKLINPFGRDKK